MRTEIKKELLYSIETGAVIATPKELNDDIAFMGYTEQDVPFHYYRIVESYENGVLTGRLWYFYDAFRSSWIEFKHENLRTA